MKYMHFRSSCTLCAIANILEFLENSSVNDIDLALHMQLPYCFRFTDYGYAMGVMNQSAKVYNLYLRKIGYVFKEERVKKRKALNYIRLHPYCMVGIKRKIGKHAVVYIGMEAERYVFLNPHKEESLEEDYLKFTNDELLSLLEDWVMFGRIEKSFLTTTKFNYKKSLTALYKYEKDLDEFFKKERTHIEIMKKRDFLLRPLALDLAPMMELISENDLVGNLKEILNLMGKLFKEESCMPYDILSKELVFKALNEYKNIIIKKMQEEDNDSRS